jgi:hypothetical protein
MKITSPQVSMSEPPKPKPRSVKSNQIVGDSLEKTIQELDHIGKESVVHTSTVESKISGPDNKVGILALHVSVTE